MILHCNSKLKSTYKRFRCLIILYGIIKEYVATWQLNKQPITGEAVTGRLVK